ncbi:hypothetical protein AAEX28_12490 [Lentisphaerota bacterium WC36G]|nr:hypothetical protein LJT99_15315 [Lentisphaerae bacterium WC36]
MADFDKLNAKVLKALGQDIFIDDVKFCAIVELPTNNLRLGKGEITITEPAIILSSSDAKKVAEDSVIKIYKIDYLTGKHYPDGMGMTKVMLTENDSNNNEIGERYGYQ